MPTYGYHCENGHDIEVLRRMSDPPITECTVCGAPVQRVFSPPAIHFKGSGFYNTDYGRKGQKPGENGKGEGKSDSGSGDGAKSGEGAKKAETKSSGDGASSGGSGNSSSNGGSGSGKPTPAKSSSD